MKKLLFIFALATLIMSCEQTQIPTQEQLLEPELVNRNLINCKASAFCIDDTTIVTSYDYLGVNYIISPTPLSSLLPVLQANHPGDFTFSWNWNGSFVIVGYNGWIDGIYTNLGYIPRGLCP